ncbi:MAG: hypothetical protein ACLTX6_09920 [Lachnospiraceae bacterium]
MTDHYREQQTGDAGKQCSLLEHMDRTEKGLRDRLEQTGFSEEAALRTAMSLM